MKFSPTVLLFELVILPLVAARSRPDPVNRVAIHGDTANLEKRRGGGGRIHGSGAGNGGSTHIPRPYGGGSYYAGGSSYPYPAGGVTPSDEPAASLLSSSDLPTLDFIGVWQAGAYMYPFNTHYHYQHPYANQIDPSKRDLRVVCLCGKGLSCTCHDTKNNTLLREVIGDPPRNSSDVRIVNDTVYINGTLDVANDAGKIGIMDVGGYLSLVAGVSLALLMI